LVKKIQKNEMQEIKMNLEDDTIYTINLLMGFWQTTNKAAVIAKSLKFTYLIAKKIMNGNKILFEDSDGQQWELKNPHGIEKK